MFGLPIRRPDKCLSTNLVTLNLETDKQQKILKKINFDFFVFRINFDVACNMDFRRYPVDAQYCEIKFESFGFQSNQVKN